MTPPAPGKKKNTNTQIQTPHTNQLGCFTLGATERLKSKKAIEQLFINGKIINNFPLRLVYQQVPKGSFPMQCAFGVSKRNFKKAVDRNTVKRKLKAAYRPLKPALYKALSDNFIGMILFNGKEIPTQETMDKNMGNLLKKWINKVSL